MSTYMLHGGRRGATARPGSRAIPLKSVAGVHAPAFVERCAPPPGAGRRPPNRSRWRGQRSLSPNRDPPSATAARRSPRAGSPRPAGLERAADAALHEPDVLRLAPPGSFAPADGDQHPSHVSRVADGGPTDGADLAPPHPGHEEKSRGHGVEPTAGGGWAATRYAAPNGPPPPPAGSAAAAAGIHRDGSFCPGSRPMCRPLAALDSSHATR